MTKEEIIQQQLVAQFPAIEGKVRIQRERRIWLDVPLTIFVPVFQYAKEQLGFVAFCTLTGLDEGTNLGFLYHLAQQRSGIVLNIKITTSKSIPVIPTVTDFFPSAELAEREVEDLFGAKVEGLPPGQHYPLPDGWPENDHPLLKDWKPPAGKEKVEDHNG